jgi:sialidase-1
MTEIQSLKTGLLYSNPKPHLRRIDATFPSVVMMDNGEMLATITLAEAFEAVNMHTHVCRSSDQGETWRLEGPICPVIKDRLTSDSARLTHLGGGRLVAFMTRLDRSRYPDEGMTNPKTLGFVPTELLLIRSDDYGRTWSPPEPITPPLTGPCFEMCSPITVLRDGRWALPTETWPDWDGHCPNGVRMIALVSNDQGRSWPQYWDIMHQPDRRVFFWESKIVELTDGPLVAVAWGYDDPAARDLPNQYSISLDAGQTWSKPRSTDLLGQTLTPIALDNGRILSVYRRIDKPGLWANISHSDCGNWINDFEAPLWGHESAGLTSHTQNMSQNFTKLRFGAPSLARLPDGTIFVAFWCYEDYLCHVRWFKLAITL